MKQGTVVYFQGEKFRVLRTANRGRDIVIQNVEGYRMTVSPLTVAVPE
jgi:hypothetical protein